MAKWVCFGTLFFNWIRWIQLYDKKNLTFVDCCDKILLNSSWKTLLTHYQTTNFRLLKLKEFADDNFKFDENGRKLSKRVENTVGKGQIARYEQFLFFLQCFQKACFPGRQKVALCGNGLTSPKAGLKSQ